MKNKIIKFMYKHQKSEKPLILFLKFIYSISNEWLLGIINLVAGAFIPIVWSSTIHISIKIILGILLVLINYYFYIIREYKLTEYSYRRLSEEIMHSCSVITQALANYTIERADGIGYFEYASNLICSELYTCLKGIFDCEFRISVVQQFVRDSNNSHYCKMIARKSSSRLNNTNRHEYSIPTNKKTYFFVKLFENNDVGYYCLVNESEIKKENFFYKSKRHSKIQQYIAILENAFSEDIAFILQIDCMEANKLGKNNDELETFASRFFAPYVSILNNAYQHERVLNSN